MVCAALSLSCFAQAPPPGDHPHEHGPAPAPTNLQVLPKNLTGEQVHEIMHKWEAQLGTECSTCHAADPTKKRPDGRPALNFADDSKPEKASARLMYTMLHNINGQYISKLKDADAKVTCGTCHRGHLDPPPYTPPPDHDHDHPGPPTAGAKPPAQ